MSEQNILLPMDTVSEQVSERIMALDAISNVLKETGGFAGRCFKVCRNMRRKLSS